MAVVHVGIAFIVQFPISCLRGHTVRPVSTAPSHRNPSTRGFPHCSILPSLPRKGHGIQPTEIMFISFLPASLAIPWSYCSSPPTRKESMPPGTALCKPSSSVVQLRAAPRAPSMQFPGGSSVGPRGDEAACSWIHGRLLASSWQPAPAGTISV